MAEADPPFQESLMSLKAKFWKSELAAKGVVQVLDSMEVAVEAQRTTIPMQVAVAAAPRTFVPPPIKWTIASHRQLEEEEREEEIQMRKLGFRVAPAEEMETVLLDREVEEPQPITEEPEVRRGSVQATMEPPEVWAMGATERSIHATMSVPAAAAAAENTAAAAAEAIASPLELLGAAVAAAVRV